jgi:predicted dehydrogenase
MAMSLLNPVKERADGRKVRYAVVGAGWIAQEDFMPGVEKTGNSVMTALVTGDAKKGRQLGEKYKIDTICGYDGFDGLLRSGKIGSARIFSSIFTQQVAPSNHRTEGDKWAGPLPDMGPYPINAVRNLFGAEPIEVFGRTASAKGDARFSEVPEMVNAWLRFPDESTTQFTVSYGSEAVSEYRVSGTEAT